MKKALASFSGGMLSREQMKKLNGGKMQYQCQCCWGVGTWTGSYSNAREAGNAIDSYCPAGPSGSVTGECVPV